MTERLLDLDSARAARFEASKEKPVVVFGGKQFEMPVELPLNMVEALTKGDIGTAMDILFGERASEFMELGPSMQDLTELVTVYGVGLGEASVSAVSLVNGGARPKRTSRGTTR